jgi:hypothetical protein
VTEGRLTFIADCGGFSPAATAARGLAYLDPNLIFARSPFELRYRHDISRTILDPALDQSAALADPGSDHCQSPEIEALSRVLKLKSRPSRHDS